MDSITKKTTPEKQSKRRKSISKGPSSDIPLISMATEKKRIAIVGSGISGLAALFTLRNTHHEVHLFESANRLGGHTNTVDWTWNGETTKVDTGFIVLNSYTYRMSILVVSPVTES
jgi:predicted NAD/FAD-binding protein